MQGRATRASTDIRRWNNGQKSFQCSAAALKMALDSSLGINSTWCHNSIRASLALPKTRERKSKMVKTARPLRVDRLTRAWRLAFRGYNLLGAKRQRNDD
eukprot:6209415-Pleurochrysis_carterae.AAC.3